MNTGAHRQGAPGDPGESEDELDALRRRIAVSLGVMFAIMMLAAGPFIDWPFGRDGWALRILSLAIATPPIMILLARSMLEAARRMEAGRGGLRGVHDGAGLDALVDPLTGLGNHRAFQEEFQRQVEHARRYGSPLALVLLDLDDLKQANDELGHAGGDAVIAAMGRLLGSDSRGADRAFRIGGDEFVVLLPRTDIDNAVVTARRLLAAALDGPTTGAHERPFSFSAGVSAFPSPSANGARLFRHADAALSWIKHHGRTDVQAYDPNRHGQAADERNSTELAAAVGSVASKRLLIPVYQPIFSLATGEVIGHEGLVRPGPDAGFTNAEALFAAAESSGRTAELDAACIEIVAAGAGSMARDRYLAVNLSPRTLESDDFSATRLAAIFGRHGLAPANIVIEITEREAVEDIHRLRLNLEACRRSGMRIAADDVGAGNAGLRLLSEVTFDLVKIDLSLVQGGAMRESSLAVLRALLELAARSSATIVAEGVETVHQLEVVRDLGIKAGQGYLLGRPARTLVTDPLDLDELIERERALQAESATTAEAAA